MISGCSTRDGSSLQIKWKKSSEVLPRGVVVYTGVDDVLPLKVWVAKIDHNSGFRAKVLVSDDEDRRETVMDFYNGMEALLVVNAGYFIMHKNPASHVGLLMSDNQLIEPASESVIRLGTRYPIARGAFGTKSEYRYDIAWVNSRNDSIFEWEDPINNLNGKPVKTLDFSEAKYWNVVDAVHAGPVLIEGGEIQDFVDEEVFFGTSIPDVHPRTAIGYTKENDLIICVVDGRQPESRGVSLLELSIIMEEFNCVEALNLDGGGSSTLVVNGTLLNRPAGGTSLREVMSAIAIVPNE